VREKYLGSANALQRQRGSLSGVIDHGLVQVLRVAQPWRPIVMTDKALSQAATQGERRGSGRMSRPRSKVEGRSLVIVAISRGVVQPLVGGDGTQHFGARRPTEHELMLTLQSPPEIPQ
jgi:hypothetical protein